LGLFIAWLVSLIDGLANFISLRNREHTIHQTERTVQNLEAKMRDLEIENAHLKGIKETSSPRSYHKEDQIVIETPHKKDRPILERLRHAFP
jgi:hypothetical protein